MPRIRVTEHHIESSVPANSSHCMIADAVKDAVGDAQQVAVDLQTIRYTRRKTGTRYVFFTPPIAQRKLLAFDQGDEEELEPFDFLLSRPVQEHEARRKNDRADRARKTTKAKKQRVKVKGGTPLPRAALANGQRKVGRRREFGLNMMGR